MTLVNYQLGREEELIISWLRTSRNRLRYSLFSKAEDLPDWYLCTWSWYIVREHILQECPTYKKWIKQMSPTAVPVQDKPFRDVHKPQLTITYFRGIQVSIWKWWKKKLVSQAGSQDQHLFAPGTYVSSLLFTSKSRAVSSSWLHSFFCCWLHVWNSWWIICFSWLQVPVPYSSFILKQRCWFTVVSEILCSTSFWCLLHLLSTLPSRHLSWPTNLLFHFFGHLHDLVQK